MIRYLIRKTQSIYDAVHNIKRVRDHVANVDISDEYFWDTLNFVSSEVRDKLHNSCNDVSLMEQDNNEDFELTKKILKQPLFY